MRRASDSDREVRNQGFRAKAEPGSPEYKEFVAEPIMRAIDAMPPEFRALVHEFGYVEVYVEYRRGYSPAAIRARLS